MDEPQTRISVSVRDDVTVAKCLDEKLDDDEMIEEWSAELRRVSEQFTGRYMIVDFQNVFIATSLVLGTLLSLKFQTRQKGMQFGLCGVNEYIMETFRMTCLDKAFIIGRDVNETLVLLKS